MGRYKIEITTTVAITNALFDDLETATDELLKLRERLAEDRWSSNKKDNRVHTMMTPAGPLDIVLETVSTARVIDTEVWHRQSQASENRAREMDLAHRRAILELENEFKPK